MQRGFNVYRRLDNGEIVHVAWRREAEQADKLMQDLNEMWPGHYGYLEAEGEPLSFVAKPPANRTWLS
jgi:hypothetical protein